jgi:hypothetical protein
MAVGMREEVFWRSTMAEVEAVFTAIAEREHAENLRFGLVAATIVNVHRKKNSRLVRPQDFFRRRRREEDFMDVKSAVHMMDAWAATHNTRTRSKAPSA